MEFGFDSQSILDFRLVEEPSQRKHSMQFRVLISLFVFLVPIAQASSQSRLPQTFKKLFNDADSISLFDEQGALSKLKEGAQMAQNGSLAMKGMASISMARFYYRNDKIDSTVNILNRMKLAGLHRSDSLVLGEYYFLQGSLLSDDDQIELCAPYYDSAIQVFQVINQLEKLGTVFKSVGIMYDIHDRHDVAKDYYGQAIRIFKKINNLRLVGHIYNNLAGIYKYEEQLATSLAYYDSCIKMYERAGNKDDLSKTYGNIAIFYIQKGPIEKAKPALDKELQYAKEADTRSGLGTAYKNALLYYLNTKEYKKAEEYGRKALAIAIEIKNSFIYERAMTDLVDVFEATGQYKNAFEFSKKYQAWSDSIHTRENEGRLFELETKYETQKKEVEIAEKDAALANSKIEMERQAVFRNTLIGLAVALGVIVFIIYRGRRKQAEVNRVLVKRNEEIEAQKITIEQNLREKESLLREIHHRVKNNLQVISSLLNMQTYHMEDPTMISAIAEGQNRVKAMALIHQKLYQTEQLSEIDFQEYTEQLVSHLSTAFGQSNKKIRSIVNGSSIKLDIDTAIPLGLILNELITNAYKYAFQGANGGDLKIELLRDGDHFYKLHVADSGAGFPADFSEEKLNSLGIKLVRMLTEQLDGTLQISNEPGANFYIRFKESRLSA
jgi:two-component sensor histidine kinase